MRRVTKPINCDGTGERSIPIAHLAARTCSATGKTFYTVDADPSDRCTIHQLDEELDENNSQKSEVPS